MESKKIDKYLKRVLGEHFSYMPKGECKVNATEKMIEFTFNPAKVSKKFIEACTPRHELYRYIKEATAKKVVMEFPIEESTESMMTPTGLTFTGKRTLQCDDEGRELLREETYETEEEFEEDSSEDDGEEELELDVDEEEESGYDDSRYNELDQKTVYDSDGFMTDYTLYYDTQEDSYLCIMGDQDFYTPDNTDPDAEFERETEAYEWFNSYEGIIDEDDFRDWDNDVERFDDPESPYYNGDLEDSDFDEDEESEEEGEVEEESLQLKTKTKSKISESYYDDEDDRYVIEDTGHYEFDIDYVYTTQEDAGGGFEVIEADPDHQWLLNQFDYNSGEVAVIGDNYKDTLGFLDYKKIYDEFKDLFELSPGYNEAEDGKTYRLTGKIVVDIETYGRVYKNYEREWYSYGDTIWDYAEIKLKDLQMSEVDPLTLKEDYWFGGDGKIDTPVRNDIQQGDEEFELKVDDVTKDNEDQNEEEQGEELNEDISSDSSMTATEVVDDLESKFKLYYEGGNPGGFNPLDKSKVILGFTYSFLDDKPLAEIENYLKSKGLKYRLRKNANKLVVEADKDNLKLRPMDLNEDYLPSEFYTVRFCRIDGDEDEVYEYKDLKDAEYHFNLFDDSDADIYTWITIEDPKGKIIKTKELKSIEEGVEKNKKVSFKDKHICQGCGNPLSKCTCEVKEEGLKEDATQPSNIGQHKRSSIDMVGEDKEIFAEDSEMIQSLNKMISKR